MKQKKCLAKFSAYVMWSVGLLLLLAVSTKEYAALIFPYFVYDFNISVYQICPPDDTATTDETRLNNRYFRLGIFFDWFSICRVGEGHWSWQRFAEVNMYQIPLPGAAGFNLQIRQFNRGEGKCERPDNFKIVIHDTREIPSHTSQGKITWPINLIEPTDSTIFRHFKTRDKSLFFISIKTTRRQAFRYMRQWKIVREIIPTYPYRAITRNIQGKVIVEAVTDIYGRVMTVKVIKGHRLLKKAAIEAVRQWVIEPYTMSSIPKQIHFKVIFHFKLLPQTP